MYTQDEKDGMAMKNATIDKFASKRGCPEGQVPDGKGGCMDKPTTVRGSRPNLGVFKTTKERNTAGGLLEPYDFKTESIDTVGYAKGKSNFQLKTTLGEGDKSGYKIKSTNVKPVSRKDVPSVLKKLNKN